MLILPSIFLLLSNAVNSQREASILNSRIAIFALVYSMWFLYNQTIYLFLNLGVALFNGLFHINSYTMTFCLFLFILSVCILFLTGFLHIGVYPSVSYKSYSEFTDEYKAKFKHFYNRTSWFIHHEWYFSDIAQNKLKTNQMYNITEYPLIILFVITGSVFLMSFSDLLSVFLSVGLQSYGLYLLSSSFRNSETATDGGLTYFLLGGLSLKWIIRVFWNTNNVLNWCLVFIKERGEKPDNEADAELWQAQQDEIDAQNLQAQQNIQQNQQPQPDWWLYGSYNGAGQPRPPQPPETMPYWPTDHHVEDLESNDFEEPYTEGMYDESDVSGDEKVVDKNTSPSPESSKNNAGQEKATKSPADNDNRERFVDTEKDREGLNDNGEGPSSKKPFKQDSSDIEKTDYMDYCEDSE